jgi:hypothetical protein
MQRTSSSCPSSIRKHAPHSISHIRIVLSDEPLTTILSRYCKQAIPRLCPSNVRTNSQVVVSYKSNDKLQKTKKSISSFIPKL